MASAGSQRQVLAREQAHRRAVLVGLGSLIVLSTSPVFAHHFPLGADAILAGKDHLWRICVIAAHQIAVPFHLAFHFLLGAGLLYACCDRMNAWLAARRELRRVVTTRPRPSDLFARAAQLADLPGGRLRVVDGLPTPAFTTGLWRPRVYVAQSLTAALSFKQLVAVLAHEAAHVRRRDPLRLTALRFLSCTLFYLPALRRLAADAADEAEIRADDHAARRHPLVLASAILALGQWQPPLVQRLGVGFQQRDLLERRVRRLAGEVVSPRSHLDGRSIVGAAAVLLLAWTTGALVTHPLPEPEHAEHAHCHHAGDSPLDHLFCLGLSFAARPNDCPHIS